MQKPITKRLRITIRSRIFNQTFRRTTKSTAKMGKALVSTLLPETSLKADTKVNNETTKQNRTETSVQGYSHDIRTLDTSLKGFKENVDNQGRTTEFKGTLINHKDGKITGIEINTGDTY